MTGLSRRDFAFGAALVPWFANTAQAAQWVNVTGSAIIINAGDTDSARRRALADALLSASFAGGADVTGHSAMSLSRMTADVLIVRPVGRVLTYDLLSQHQSGNVWQVHIRAKVGPADRQACSDRRSLVLTVYPPDLRVSPNAPAWADALGHQIAVELVDLTRRRPEVAELHLAQGLPQGDPSRDDTSWRVLTRGSSRVPAGGHELHMTLQIVPEGRALVLKLGLHLRGPAQEEMVQDHVAQIPLPDPSPLGRAAPLVQPDRVQLAHKLGKGAVPALDALLKQAGCQPLRAVITQEGSALVVPVGRKHGLTRGALAFTLDRDHSTEMLEVTKLSDRSGHLTPLDPTHAKASFAGRPVRFIDTGQGLG
jgi:hypothetical protein